MNNKPNARLLLNRANNARMLILLILVMVYVIDTLLSDHEIQPITPSQTSEILYIYCKEKYVYETIYHGGR